MEGRWRDLQMLLNRPGNLTGPGFEPGPELLEFLQVFALFLSPPSPPKSPRCLGALPRPQPQHSAPAHAAPDLGFARDRPPCFRLGVRPCTAIRGFLNA